MLGWIERRLRQASGLLDTAFGGYSVILVGDNCHLIQIKYCTIPSQKNQQKLMGYCVFRNCCEAYCQSKSKQ